MSAWRIVPDDAERPVRLSLGGTEYVVTVTEAMSLLRTAPKMAGKWEMRGPADDQYGASRYDVHNKRVADVWHQSTLGLTGIECWIARTAAGDASGVSLADAMQAADAALRAAGWLLEEG